MSKAFLITYDLHKPLQEYIKLHEAIKQASKWWHFLESTWIIIVNDSDTPDTWWQKLSNTIDQNDFLLIIEIKRSAQGWLPQKAWDWINQNVPL